VPLGNGEPVSWTFQPYPYGTGALMEKLIHERGAAAFARDVFTVEKWTGAVPTTGEDIAFLPAHRLSALLKERKITSTDLTKIYLDRIKKYDPTLLCAVTIMEEQAMAEAAKADAEIKAGKYRGPLHGIPYGVKDLFSTKGVRTTWGAGDFENRVIDEDAENRRPPARSRRGADGQACDPDSSRRATSGIAAAPTIRGTSGAGRADHPLVRRRRPPVGVWRSVSGRRRRDRSCRRRVSAG
jgi:hypothetical protein